MANTNAILVIMSGLNDTIRDLTTEAINPIYTRPEQERLSLEARALNARLRALHKLHFEAQTAGYQEAIAGIKVVNEELDRAIVRINNLISFFTATATLVAALDRLIGAARPL